MSEEQILQQDAPAAEKKGFFQKIMEHKLLVFLPAVVVVVAILLGYFADTLSPILTGMPFKYIMRQLLTNLVSSTGPYIVALLLPAAVIIAKKVNKPILTKILFFASLAFILVQLFAVLVCLIFGFFDYYNSSLWSAIRGFFSGFRGSELLSSLYSMLRNLFSGMPFMRVIGYMFNNGVIFLAELLFIVKNVLCALLCLPALKKK